MGDHYDPYHRNARSQYDPRDRHDSYRDPPASYSQYDRQRRSPSSRYDSLRAGSRRDDHYDSGYSFRGAADGDYYRPDERETFSFRAAGPSAPRFPPQDQRPQPQRQEARRNADPRRGPPKSGVAGRRDQRSQGGRGRGGFTRRKPHTRDILTNVHGGSTPEQLHGMNGDGQAHFLTLDSSSEDESDEQDVTELANSSGDDTGDQPRKRVKREPAPEPAVPKWSNPDPYTSLPPPETLGAPKKDIVKVIRKAKIDSGPKVDSANAVKDNVDFISFNFDAASEEGQVSEGDDDDGHTRPPSNAPSAPATMRQWDLPQKPPVSNGLQTSQQTHSSISSLSHPSASRDADMMDTMPPPPPPDDLDIPTTQEIAAHLASQPKSRKRKFDRQAKAVGQVLPEWEARGNNPTPWCIVDHSHESRLGLRLHNEICDFFEFVRPYDYEEAVRRDLIVRVQDAVRGMRGMDGGRNVEIRCFGSFAAGVYLPTADMDLVAVTPGYLSYGLKSFGQTNSKIRKLATHLEFCGLAARGSVSPVLKAKVPIIKFVDNLSGIRVDLSFENDTGLIANNTFATWKDRYPAMPKLVALIKQLLAMRGLNEVFTGGLGGFSIICLVVNMLHQMKIPRDDEPRLGYGDLLLEFLDVYGNKLNIERTGLIMDPPGYYNKVRNPMPKQNAQNLTIIDPNNPNNDISGGSRCIREILALFRNAQDAIHDRLGEVSSGTNVQGSLLQCILGGNYDSFMHQRNKLSMLHRGHPVSPPPLPAPKAQPPPREKPQLPAKPPPPASSKQQVPASEGPGQITVGKKKRKLMTTIDPDSSSAPADGPTRKNRKKNKKAKAQEARDRALTFASEHPGATDVPEKLSKSAAKKLRKKLSEQLNGTITST